MKPEPPQPEPKPFKCGGCGMQLPMVPATTPAAVRLACAFCGSRYLGEVWTSIPDNLKGNIRIIKDE